MFSFQIAGIEMGQSIQEWTNKIYLVHSLEYFVTNNAITTRSKYGETFGLAKVMSSISLCWLLVSSKQGYLLSWDGVWIVRRYFWYCSIGRENLIISLYLRFRSGKKAESITYLSWIIHDFRNSFFTFFLKIIYCPWKQPHLSFSKNSLIQNHQWEVQLLVRNSRVFASTFPKTKFFRKYFQKTL